jgi:acetyl esterase/lipase
MKIVKFQPNPDSNAHVTGFLHEVSENIPNRRERPCVVICPGGGYTLLSDREAEPPAMMFYAKGYQVFILYYSIGDKIGEMRPVVDASLTMIKIRENSEQWHVIPNRIAMLGFSAGGHVTACLGTLWDSPELKAKVDTKGGLNRPDAIILCYAVLTGGKFVDSPVAYTMCGGKPTQEQICFFSPEKQVSEKTPPTFLWHTFEDDYVPVDNTILFVSALQKHNIPFECHIFQKGRHGMSVCTRESNTPNAHNAQWVPLCMEWLGNLFDFPD